MAARYRVVYYRTDSGREPVAEWLDGRTSREQAKLFWALERLAESGFLLGPPWLKKLDDDIWEVRVQHGHLYARILFYERTKRVFVLLHAFAKRSQRTPKQKLHAARAHLMADWESHAE